jgi:hypothetical protein
MNVVPIFERILDLSLSIRQSPKAGVAFAGRRKHRPCGEPTIRLNVTPNAAGIADP